MGAKILTGYTGEKHITPLDDAAVYRAVFGSSSYILDEGDKCIAEMPSNNEFTLYSGLLSIQGIQTRVTRETLSIDTCPSGKTRIDLVAARYTHDINSKIDNVEIEVIKGVEVDDSNDPTVPAYNSGDIDDGATAVDMPLYKISLAGANVVFEKVAKEVDATIYSLLIDTEIDPSVISLYESLGWTPPNVVANNTWT